MKNDNLIISDAPIDEKDANREENDVLMCDECEGYLFTPVFVLI